jgi:tripartite-type tricarboxylate transporter receptor subunit TctC
MIAAALPRGLACMLALSAVGNRVAAQDWLPSKPVRIIVPFAGGTNDALARLVAPELSRALGQPVFVEDRGGGGGNIGADLVAKSAPDGQTLLVGYNGPIAINPTLFVHMPYDPLTDLTPITLAVKSPQFLAVYPGLPVANVAEFVALAKAKPGGIAYGSVSIGSASHLTMEMLKAAAHIDVTHVPYKGAGPAVVDLLAGQVQAAFLVPGNILPHARNGTARLIASTGETRFAATPEIPTMIEQGFPDFIAVAWIGFLAPGGTPQPIVDRYNRELVRILKLPDVRERLEQDMQVDVVASTPDVFGRGIRAEFPRWATVIKATGATVD